MFYEKGALKNFLQKLHENTCNGVSFLTKFQACCDTGIFLTILQKF